MWQDIVITSGSIIFALVLLPQLIECYRGARVNVWTATLTGTILGVYCVVYASLGMWIAAIPITASVWLGIAYLSWRNRHGDLNKDTPCTGD